MRQKGIKILNICTIAAMAAMLLPQVVLANNEKSEGEYRKDVILAKFKGDDEARRVSVFPYETVEETLARVGAQENVEYAETDAIYHIASIEPNDPDFGKQWHLEQIKASGGWEKAVAGSREVVVAVLDSGVDINHPDLKNNIWKNHGEAEDGKDNDGNGYIDDVNGWNFVEKNNNVVPRFSEGWTNLGINHGTIVAGILGAEGNNGAGITGVAWKVNIMPLRVLDSQGAGDTRDVAKAIDYAIFKKARILNLSFVGFEYNKTLEVAIERAHRAGLLIVAAAGNDMSASRGINLDQDPMYPICYDGPEGENWILGVTALDPLDQRAYFASYGKAVDVAAPGVGIWSTVLYKPSFGFDVYTKGYWSGTSVAVPQAAGLAVLLYGARPSLTADDVMSIIKTNADFIDSSNDNVKGKMGTGRINVASAVQSLLGENVSSLSILLNPYVLSASVSGVSSEVKIFNANGHEVEHFAPYNPNFKGGAQIASADVNGDKYPEIITAAGPGGGPHVRIFDYAGKALGGFFAFPMSFRGGVNISAADLDNNGTAEIIAAPGVGMEPEVRIIRSDGIVIDSFFAYPTNFKKGVRVSVADLDGDKYLEIITAQASGGNKIKIFRYDGVLLNEFSVFDDKYKGGINLSAGDTNGDGKDEIIIGADKGNAPEIKIFDKNGKEIISFYAFGADFKGGVGVSALDADLDGKEEIVASSLGETSQIRIFNSIGLLITNISVYRKDAQNGIFVAGMWR